MTHKEGFCDNNARSNNDDRLFSDSFKAELKIKFRDGAKLAVYVAPILATLVALSTISTLITQRRG